MEFESLTSPPFAPMCAHTQAHLQTHTHMHVRAHSFPWVGLSLGSSPVNFRKQGFTLAFEVCWAPCWYWESSCFWFWTIQGFPGSSAGKVSACNARDPCSIPSVGKICWRKNRLPTPVFLGFPCGSAGEESACNAETWVQSLGWKGPLEKGKATHSSILAWRIPWTVHGVAKGRTRLSDFHFRFEPFILPLFLMNFFLILTSSPSVLTSVCLLVFTVKEVRVCCSLGSPSSLGALSRVGSFWPLLRIFMPTWVAWQGLGAQHLQLCPVLRGLCHSQVCLPEPVYTRCRYKDVYPESQRPMLT